MPKTRERCIYMIDNDRGGHCNLKFNRGNPCTVCEQHTPEREHIPSFPETSECRRTSLDVFERLFGDLIRNEERILKSGVMGEEHSRTRHQKGHYPFIPRNAGYAMDMLTHAFKYLESELGRRPKFLDCGCGVGNIVILATFAGFDAYGIEYDALTLRRGRKLVKQFGIDPKKLIKGDLLKYSKYHKYDLLYGFCPMCDYKLEAQFEQKLRIDIKIGAGMIGLGARNSYEKIGKDRAYFKRIVLDQSDNCGSANVITVKMAHETG